MFSQKSMYVYESTAQLPRPRNGQFLKNYRRDPCTFTKVQRDIRGPEICVKTCDFWIPPMVIANADKNHRISQISCTVTSSHGVTSPPPSAPHAPRVYSSIQTAFKYRQLLHYGVRISKSTKRAPAGALLGWVNAL